MKYRTLGRTQLQVSVLGLGSGGPSRLGQAAGLPYSQIYRLMLAQLDHGVNLIDTAAGYGESEIILGKALRGVPRDRYHISTKTAYHRKGRVLSPQNLVRQVERSLRRLRIETIDILQFHGVKPDDYDPVVDRLLPAAERLRTAGKINFVGVSETFSTDGSYQMLQRAATDAHFDVVMIGYNFVNSSAERKVLPVCRENNIGVLAMFAVRALLRDGERLRSLPSVNESLPELGYRFAVSHPAVSTVLSGSASLGHLESNRRAILAPPLTPIRIRQLRAALLDRRSQVRVQSASNATAARGGARDVHL